MLSYVAKMPMEVFAQLRKIMVRIPPALFIRLRDQARNGGQHGTPLCGAERLSALKFR
jgi:hypothetical protein